MNPGFPNYYSIEKAFFKGGVSTSLELNFTEKIGLCASLFKSCFMNKQLLLFPVLFFLCQHLLIAQVAPPCPTPPPPGAEACPTACVYCDFDGYMGINNGTPSGGNTVCGQIFIHNDQWFGFVAGTQSITINIATSNCQAGNGLQAAFFSNCQSDALTCNPGSAGGGGQPLLLTYSNFVPGQTYFLMVDGWTNDVCNYEIEVLDGSVSPPAPAAPSAPEGPTQVCPGAVVEYTIPQVEGAGYYTWTGPPGSRINGTNSNTLTLPAPNGNTVTITFGNLGGTVCVRVGNACFPPQQACITVTNQPIPPTIKPKLTLCYQDLPFFWDEQPFNIINNPGTYNLQSTPYDSYLGCDSIVRQTVEIKFPIISNMGIRYICEGQCFEFNGNSYCNAGGPFSETLQSVDGCDSVVQFTIVKVPAVANIGGAQTIDCNSPALTLNSNGSTTGPTVTYTWANAAWTTIGNQSTQNVNMTGTYHLIVTNNFAAAGCKDTATVVVPGNTVPPGATASGGNITCLASSTTLQGSSPTSGVNYLWAGPGITPANQNQQNPNVNQTGTYTLTVTNPVNGCTSTATATVTGDVTPPTASATGDTINCLQSTATINSSTNAPTPSYNWAGPGINAGNQNVANPNVTQPGNYTVTITNTGNGCTSTASATVIQDTDIPTANAGNDQLITCLQSSVTLNGSGNAGGAPAQFLWTGAGINAGNQNNPTPTVNTADTYILTVTNLTNGCFRKDTVVVTSNIVLPSVDAGNDQTLTCVLTTVTIGGNNSAQGPDYSATWTGPGINAGNQNQYNPQVNTPGTYTLTISNAANGCSASETVVISQDIAAPAASAGPDQMLTCSSPNGIVLNGSGTPAGIAFLWSGPGIGANNQNLPNPTVTVPGDYTLQVTNPANGCTATDQATVTQDADVPSANAGPDLVLNCTVNSVNINGSGSSSGPGITYQWSGPGISGANATAQSPSNITVPGTYNLTVTNTNNNCFNTDVVVVLQDITPPTASSGGNLILNCFNNATDTLDASASSTGPNFTYLWSGPGITPANQNEVKPVVTVPGVYTVVVTNTDNTCTASAQATVTDDLTPPNAIAGPNQTIDCVTTSATLGGNSSSGPNFSYLWTGPGITPANATLAQPVVSLPGTYIIVVSNSTNGCTSSNFTLVNTNAVYPTASAGTNGLLTCAQTSYVLDGSGSSSGANFQTQWSGPGINAGNQNQLTPSVTQPGIYILSITNTNNFCVSTDTVEVTQDIATPAAAAGQDWMLNCQTTNVTLDGSQSATGANIAYLWTGPGINAGNQNQQSPNVTQPGNYALLVTNTSNGCTAQDDVTVNQDIAQPTADAGASFTLTCAQNSRAIDASASSVGTNFEYLWQGPGINTSNFNVQNPVVADSGTYTLLVTNIVNFCTATAQVYVALDGDFPVANAGIDRTLTCAIDTLLLDGSQSQTGPGITYSWTGPGIVAGQQNMMSPLIHASGAYTLVVTNTNNGCSKIDVVNVNEDYVPPIANAGPDQIITCANSTTGVPLNSSASSSGPDYAIQWSGPGITTANQNQPNPVVLVPGSYTLLITSNLNGCTSSDQVTVNQDQNLPTASAGTDQTLTCDVQSVTLDGSGSFAPGGGTIVYEWSGPGIAGNSSEVKPNVTVPGIYTLTIFIPTTGCQATDNVEVFLDNVAPVLTISTDTITCDAPQGTLSVTSSLPNTQFLWSGIGINPNNQSLATLQVGDPGLYTVVGTAPNGCTATATTIMAVDANFPEGAAEGTELNCFNNGVAQIGGAVVTPGATHFWTGPGGFQSNDLVVTVTQAGAYTFNIVAPNGCVRPIPVTVTQNFTKPQVNATVPQLLNCSITSVTINTAGTSIGGNFTYQWTTSDGNIVSGANGLNPVADKAGTYKFVVSNNLNGCKDSVTVQVINDPEVPTAFDLSVQNILCFGEDNGAVRVNNVVGGTPPFIFTFDGGATGNQYTNLTAGNYTIALVDANGCKLDTVVTITEPGELVVELGDDIEVQLGESATVLAQIANETPIESITWNYAPGCDSLGTVPCLEFTYAPLESYRHVITVRDVNGCVVRDQVIVKVRKDRLIYVPNIFKPNSNDPLNSLLMIHGGTGVVKVHKWQIFDRWGSSVFAVADFPTDDPTFAWDGRVRGTEAHTGVYVWWAEIEFLDGEVELFKGDVTIIR